MTTFIEQKAVGGTRQDGQDRQGNAATPRPDALSRPAIARPAADEWAAPAFDSSAPLGMAEDPDGAGPTAPCPDSAAGVDRPLEPSCDLCVVGLGYIGLPTAAAFAEAGLNVTGVDTDPARVALVNSGRTPFGEPGLDAALMTAVTSGRLVARQTPVRSRAYLIAVPTPLGADRQPCLDHVDTAARSIAPFLAPGSLVILESTVPVGATSALADTLTALRPDLPGTGDGPDALRIAHCPERVLPGRIMEELRQNDRVIGGLLPACATAAARLYARIGRGRCHLTDAATAEMTKLAENAYRDVNIAYANELQSIAEVHGLDVRTVIGLANRHPRVSILDPGPGVGGHCIAIDPWFLAASAPDVARLIPAARAINEARPAQVAAQAADMVRDRASPVIACLGLAYKRDVGDLRESPALEVTRRLAGMDLGTVLAVEPHIDALPPDLEDVELVTAGEALGRADLLVLLTDHSTFRHLPAASLDDVAILDTRGLWRPGASPAGTAPLGPVPAAPRGAGRPIPLGAPSDRSAAAPMTDI